MKFSELKAQLAYVGIVVDLAHETVNNRPVYRISGELGLFTKNYLIELLERKS